MKALALIAVVMTGCMSSQEVADKEWDGSKGEFPPGRVINYKGHGIGYDSHARHHYHMDSVRGHHE